MRLYLATTCALAASATLALPTVADAVLPGRNGPLAAFTELESRDGLHGTLEFFGGGRKAKPLECLLSDATGADEETPCPRNPAFAPHSRRVAYELGSRLVVRRFGANATRLGPLTDRDSDPAWSPDGKRLFFVGRRAGEHAIYSVRADGTDLSKPLAPGHAPAVSRRGRVAYVAGGVVRVLNPVSGARTRLARGGYPDWSPSGRSVVFQRRSSTYIVSASGRKRPRRLLRRARRAVFSPDGTRLAFLRVARGDQTGRFADYSVFSARLDGSRAKILRRGGEVETGSEFNSYRELAWGNR